MYTAKEIGGKLARKPHPLQRNSYRNLKSENSQDYAQKKFYVHELGFRKHCSGSFWCCSCCRGCWCFVLTYGSNSLALHFFLKGAALQMKARWESNINVWLPFMYSQQWNWYFRNRVIMFSLSVPTLIYSDKFIYFQDRSAYSAAGKYVDRSWEYVNLLQTYECGN